MSEDKGLGEDTGEMMGGEKFAGPNVEPTEHPFGVRTTGFEGSDEVRLSKDTYDVPIRSLYILVRMLESVWDASDTHRFERTRCGELWIDEEERTLTLDVRFPFDQKAWRHLVDTLPEDKEELMKALAEMENVGDDGFKFDDV